MKKWKLERNLAGFWFRVHRKPLALNEYIFRDKPLVLCNIDELLRCAEYCKDELLVHSFRRLVRRACKRKYTENEKTNKTTNL